MKRISFYSAIAGVLLLSSCTGMFDNVREYAEEETVYAGKLDGIQGVKYGYERVEIDLMADGRLPASQMSLGRAVKTVVECPYFEEPGHRRVIDSLASWLNITGLTKPDLYDFTIYTEDKYGNKSLPITVQIQPYTSENLKSLGLTQPFVTESNVAAQLEWREHQSNVTYTMYGYEYSYTDKDGIKQGGAGTGDMPSFLIDNVEKGKDVMVDVTCTIVPNITLSNGSYTPLLDQVTWQTSVKVRISDDAKPAIFLKEPLSAFSFDFDEQTYPLTFSWTAVPGVTAYTLKLSTSSTFAAANTVTFNPGTTAQYSMTKENINQLLSRKGKVRSTELFWTVEASGAGNITTQTRKFNVTRKPVLVGKWTFDNSDDLYAAEEGNALSALGSKTVTSTTGPTPHNGAANVSSGTYLRLKHGLPTPCTDFTISMYIMQPWRAYRPLVNFNQGDGNPAEVSVNTNCALTIADGPTGGKNVGVAWNTWHFITITVSNGAVVIYMDGYQVLSGSSAADRFKLTENYMTLFADGGGSNSQGTNICDLALWDMPLLQDEILAYYKLKKVDHLECSINNYSGEAMTVPENIIDGTVSGAAYYGQCDPLMAVIDMGRKRNLGYVVVCGYIWSGDDAKFFDLSLSDNGASYAQFTPIGTINTPGGGWAQGTFYTIDLSETDAKGRYFKVLGREPWDQNNHYILISEVLMYEKTE